MFIDQLKQNKKRIAILIDPDKSDNKSLDQIFNQNVINEIDAVFTGGSILFNKIDKTIFEVKQRTKLPVAIFPGNAFQISDRADIFLLLNLISGRNPDMLIGHHVMAAPQLRQSGLEIVSTGYMLFDCGPTTSVQYMSNTMPIPNNKPDIAIATAMAGEMIGMKTLYLEAGSGAKETVNPEIVRKVKKNVTIPVIVGGGIKTASHAKQLWEAGANMLVIGTAIEKQTSFLNEIINARSTL